MYFLSNLHNNSILTGSVDSYCLVCDSYLRSEDEAFTHTEKPIHKKNLGGATRLEKFLDDHIVKVKRGYYCTFCNILLSTMTKVGLHISEISHQENKGAQMLARDGDNVIAFDEVAINWKSWHGFIENTCVICNTEFEEEDIHRINQNHILKLIQSKCEFGDKYLYRKVDEESFFCLICGGVFTISDRPNHHETTKHNIFYNHGKELKNKMQADPQVKAKKTKIEQPKHITENETKDNVTDQAKSPVSETDTNSNAANIKKKKLSAKSIAVTLTKTEMEVAECSKSTTSKETKTVDSEMTKVIEAKNVELTAINTAPGKTKNTEELNAKVAKVGAQDNLGSSMAFTNADTVVSKADDFIDSAAKVINATNKDLNMSEYLNVNNYIVQDEKCQSRCVLCDVICIERKDLEVHLSNDLHHQVMLNKHKKALFEKINEDSMKTNEVFPPNDLVMHKGNMFLDNPENRPNDGVSSPSIMNAQQPKLNLDIAPPLDIQSKIRKQNPYSDISSDEEDEYRTKILEKVDKFQHNNITIDISAEKAYCKQCNKDVLFDADALDKHIDEQHENDNSMFNKPEIDSKMRLVIFARENYMICMQNEIYCKLCKTILQVSMESMVQHINLDTHKQKAFCKNGKGPLKKMQSSDFIQTFFRVESSLGGDIILNNKYVLKPYSFHCVVLEDEVYKCMMCGVNFSSEAGDDLAQHLDTTEHKIKMGMCDVVISLPEEFIREITPGRYHCGYCNRVTSRWLAMQEHLLRPPHAHARRHARWSLERCHALVRNCRATQLSSRGPYNQLDVNLFPPPAVEARARPPRSPFHYLLVMRRRRASMRGPQTEPEG